MGSGARPLRLIDAHVHVWDPRHLDYGWLDGEPELARPRLPLDIPRSNGRVDAMVFVEADRAPEQGLAEARWVASLSDWPELVGIVAYAPIELGPAVVPHLDRLRALPRVVGVRRALQNEPPAFLTAPLLRMGLQTVASAGLPFDAVVRSFQLPALVDLVSGTPTLRVVLDHLGKPPVALGLSSPEGAAWARTIRRLAALPNTFVKLSGLAPEADPDRPLVEQAGAFLRLAVDAFGPDRSMLGSDWPVSATPRNGAEPEEWFAIVRQAIRPTQQEWNAIARTTATRCYGLQG